MNGISVPTTIIVDTVEFLQAMIKVPSLRGKEEEVGGLIEATLSPYVDSIQRIPMTDAIQNEPEYDFRLPDFSYSGSFNIVARVKGKPSGKKVIINTHMDVVPATQPTFYQTNESPKEPNHPENQSHDTYQIDLFKPHVKDGHVYGRGAVDAKGQIALLYMFLRLLRETKTRCPGDIILHIVVEEENGGNGTLAVLKEVPVKADGAIILEPSDMALCAAVRGAVWFSLTVHGQAAHSGSTGRRRNAIDIAYQAIQLFQDYHDNLLTQLIPEEPLFQEYPDPMPLTIGQLNGGSWPSTVAAQAAIKGVFGFLPSATRYSVQKKLHMILKKAPCPWLRDNFNLTFPMLNNEGTRVSLDAPLVTTYNQACIKNSIHPRVTGMPASCDAWQYPYRLGVPAVVFGAGKLQQAHSNHEHIPITDITHAARILVDYVRIFQKNNLSSNPKYMIIAK